jgi:hypothetical protein
VYSGGLGPGIAPRGVFNPNQRGELPVPVRKSRILIGALSLFLASHPLSGRAQTAAADVCAHRGLGGIPVRAPTAVSGSAFVARVEGLDDDAREAAIHDELVAGNVPNFERRFAPVTISEDLPDGSRLDATVCVAPDYLAIGSDSDYMLVPMRLATALDVAGRYGFVLPTPKIVDAIYAQSRARLRPQPLPASDAMRSTAYYLRHNQMVHSQRRSIDVPLGALTAGDKKDIVITSRLWGKLDRVAIYGWHEGIDRPIQPLSTVHGWHYADYSHGVRLVSAIAYVNGAARSIVDLLSDPESASLMSDEGAIPRLSGLLSVLSPHKAFSVPSIAMLR